jgi:hypothetical protein
MAWVAASGIVLVGIGVVFEGVKGLQPPPPGKKPKTSKGTAVACLVIGAAIMAAGVAIPLLWS